jgi:hypothetical protein
MAIAKVCSLLQECPLMELSPLLVIVDHLLHCLWEEGCRRLAGS